MDNPEDIEQLVQAYIDKNFDPNSSAGAAAVLAPIFSVIPIFSAIMKCDLDKIDFRRHFNENKHETFSEMLMRLVNESGEKNSVIYNRANIDRRHFSKIISHKDYKPSKQTALAFAVALKLNFERTKELLAAAGYVLTKSTLFDVIVSFFIEHKIFDVDYVNRILHKYNQPLPGG
ncbi:MAG: hypothetical protein IJ774_03575 [Selenomonadaceae bacterium]|nr:hypothetical protein [Selenomonadaceae bacterium]